MGKFYLLLLFLNDLFQIPSLLLDICRSSTAEKLEKLQEVDRQLAFLIGDNVKRLPKLEIKGKAYIRGDHLRFYEDHEALFLLSRIPIESYFASLEGNVYFTDFEHLKRFVDERGPLVALNYIACIFNQGPNLQTIKSFIKGFVIVTEEAHIRIINDWFNLIVLSYPAIFYVPHVKKITIQIYSLFAAPLGNLYYSIYVTLRIFSSSSRF